MSDSNEVVTDPRLEKRTRRRFGVAEKKRLEQGQFRVRASSTGQRALTWTDLQLLLEGIEVQKMRRFKRYRHAA